VHKKANDFSVERTKDKKKHLSQEKMDNPPKSLAAAEARIASKDAQLIEIEIELDRRKTYTYDLRTTLAVRGAGGCLTAKKGAWYGAVLVRCGAVFVDLFHFLLLFYCS